MLRSKGYGTVATWLTFQLLPSGTLSLGDA